MRSNRRNLQPPNPSPSTMTTASSFSKVDRSLPMHLRDRASPLSGTIPQTPGSNFILEEEEVFRGKRTPEEARGSQRKPEERGKAALKAEERGRQRTPEEARGSQRRASLKGSPKANLKASPKASLKASPKANPKASPKILLSPLILLLPLASSGVLSPLNPSSKPFL